MMRPSPMPCIWTSRSRITHCSRPLPASTGPIPDKKSGLIVDYIGVFKDLQRALNFDPSTFSRGLVDLEQLKLRFVALLAQAQAAVAPIEPQRVAGRTDRILDYFFDPAVREPFFQIFKDLQDAYEILSPDPFLYDYMNEYALLADIYQTVSFNLDPKTGRRRFEYQFLQKTDRLIREHVTAYAVAAPLPLYPINRNLADVIAQDQISERVKVINLQRSLTAYIEQNLEHAPYLATLGAEVEKVIEQLRLKQISAQTALTQLEAHAGHAVTLDEERHASDLTDLAFALRTGFAPPHRSTAWTPAHLTP